jgi:hypothetical protein
MAHATVIESSAAWRCTRRAAAVAVVLLAAFPSAARCAEPEDTVRVEWAASANGSLVILNAYAVRSGKLLPESVHGLLIERDPAAAPTHRYPLVNPMDAYAPEGGPFLRGIGLSEITLDTMANGGVSSQFTNQFDVGEWTGLLKRLLVEKAEIVEGAHRVIIQKVDLPVQRVFADELNGLFSGHDDTPVLPHLRLGRIALLRGPDGGLQKDSIDFGSVALDQHGSVVRYLKNYGARPVETKLSVSDEASQAGFSAGAVQTLVVPAGNSVPVSLVFAPRQEGPHGGTLDFLVNGISVAQMTFAGRGVSPGILPRVREWAAARAELLLGLLALVLAILVAWKRGVTLGLPWGGRQTIPMHDLERTEPSPHYPLTPSAGRPEHAAVRRQLFTARHAIEDALAALGEDPVPPGDKRADDLRRLRTLEHAESAEARSGLEARIGTIMAERDGLAAQVRTLEGERASLTQQVRALEVVQAENGILRTQKTAAEDTATSLRGDVNRLSGEHEKLRARLNTVAEVLELSDDMVSDGGWPETERRLPELGDGGKPRYLWNFEQLVGDLTAIFEEIALQAGEGRMAAAVSGVLSGSNNNAGLRTLNAELKREGLARHLGLGHSRDLRDFSADRFYRGFMDGRFRPIIDNIAKLGLYARSRSPEFGMGQRLTREGVDPALLERALALVETRMRVDFGVTVDTVRLFEERFDSSRHDTASHSTLRHTLPDLEASIRRLPPETIYDITSVGLRSEGLGVSVRPVVAWVTSQ